MFLSQLEVQQLTGLRQAAAQRRHLSRVGIAFTQDIAGRPVITRTAVEAPSRSSNQPNFHLITPPKLRSKAA
jgi:hypothetical protein